MRPMSERSPPPGSPSVGVGPSLGDGTLDRDLARLLAETNDQRRRFGQALWFFHRTLAFWGERNKTFAEATRLWAPAGAALFSAMAKVLHTAGQQRRDEALRRFAADTMERLAADLARGPELRVAFLLYLDSRFPQLTALMREEQATTRIFDHELADVLARGFAAAAASDPGDPTALAEGFARLAVELR